MCPGLAVPLFCFPDDISLLHAIELDFLKDPANAYLFTETVETSVPKTSVPGSSVPEASVPESSVPEASVPKRIAKPGKRKQPVTEASSKKRRNNAPKKNKKEPELVSVHV